MRVTKKQLVNEIVTTAATMGILHDDSGKKAIATMTVPQLQFLLNWTNGMVSFHRQKSEPLPSAGKRYRSSTLPGPRRD